MMGTLIIWRHQIKHPDPDCAVRFGFILIARALRELILCNRRGTFYRILPIDDTLQQELPRMFLRNLGVEAVVRTGTTPAPQTFPFGQ